MSFRARFLGILLIASLPAAAPAQDLGVQLLDAERAFMPQGQYVSWSDIRYSVERMLPQIEGNWLLTSFLPHGDAAALQETILGGCARPGLVFEVVVNGPSQFEMRRTSEVDGIALVYSTTYGLVTANNFQRWSNDRDFLLFMGLIDRVSGVVNAAAESVLISSAATRFASVALFHPSPDILVLQPSTASVEVYARCP